VLNWLNGDSELVVAYQRDAAAKGEELVRASQSGAPEVRPEALLRASGEPETSVKYAQRCARSGSGYLGKGNDLAASRGSSGDMVLLPY